jgi:2-methylisocitrate lyase-like PEP mutase family enzyme
MIDRSLQASRAGTLRALHHGSEPLLLPNAWDAASARAVAQAGFPAVATTSGGVAASLGWRDGENTPIEDAFAAIARMARTLEVPLTADVEGGYGLGPEALVARLLGAGAVGCNLEDSDHRHPGTLVEAETHAARIAAMKCAGRAAGVDLVLNARIDVILLQAGKAEDRLAETMRRARLYLDAGADCVFPILVKDEASISALVKGIRGPLNVLALEGGLAPARLGELGVARISFGGRLQRMAMADHERRLTSIRSGGSL